MTTITHMQLPKGNLMTRLVNQDGDRLVIKEISHNTEVLSVTILEDSSDDNRRIYLSREDITNILPLLQNFVTFGRTGIPWEFTYKDADGSMKSKIVYSKTDDREDAILEFETNYPDLTWRTTKKLV